MTISSFGFLLWSLKKLRWWNKAFKVFEPLFTTDKKIQFIGGICSIDLGKRTILLCVESVPVDRRRFKSVKKTMMSFSLTSVSFVHTKLKSPSLIIMRGLIEEFGKIYSFTNLVYLILGLIIEMQKYMYKVKRGHLMLHNITVRFSWRCLHLSIVT